jgi:uroporphyrinogen-III synthase
MLLVRAEQARDHLPDTLRAAGADVTIAEAYRTVIPPDSVEGLRTLFAGAPPDAITFTSSSTATNFFVLLEAAGLSLTKGIALASIGPITSETLRALGHAPTVEAKEASARGLAAALTALWAD